MADPFVNYNAALQAFMQGGRTDTASLYEATNRLRQTSFVGEESTPLSRFYDDVAQRYYEKTEAAKIEEESMREKFEKRYKAAEDQWLSIAKEQLLENRTNTMGRDLLRGIEQQKQVDEISAITSVEDFRKRFPSFKMQTEGGGFKSSARRSQNSMFKILTETGERRKASEIYRSTALPGWGTYAKSLTDIEVFGSQSASAKKSAQQELDKLAKENERRQREFNESKQQLLESAETIGRTKRPGYVERPL
jgi:hypothetical protein